MIKRYRTSTLVREGLLPREVAKGLSGAAERSLSLLVL